MAPGNVAAGGAGPTSPALAERPQELGVGKDVEMELAWEPSPLLRAINSEREFTAQIVEAVGAEHGSALAQRIIARAERSNREDRKTLRLMLPTVFHGMREELKGR